MSENGPKLINSVKEGISILRGETKPSRRFKVNVAGRPSEQSEGYAICVKSDQPELLIPSKVYWAVYSSNGLIGITDEAGEAAIYPADHFIKLEFPSEIVSVLGHLQAA